MTTYNEAMKLALEYFCGDELAASVYLGKYALKTPEGDILEPTPDLMHRRLAKEFARIEAKYPNPMSEEEIFGLFDKFKFVIPQGSPMSGIGNKYSVQSLGNCFVCPSPFDSYSGICKTDQELAQLAKRRAGVGFDISNLRPNGFLTNNAARSSTGIGPFMERYSNTTRETAQGGRRAALLLSISVHHPEIETFINIKKDKKKVTGANISIRLSDEFMEAVKNNTDYQQRFPVDASNPTFTKMVSAKKIWDQIIQAAWESAEPGLFFWDNVLKNSPASCYGVIDKDFIEVSSNPCFHGDTLIAVADGRNAVSIKQLAEENKDVPVYSVDKTTGKVSIKMGRHPRVTGENQKLIRVTLDDGSYFDVTPNHSCLLLNGEKVEAKDLKPGDSLPRFQKIQQAVKKGGENYWLLHTNVHNAHKERVFEHRLISKFHNEEKWNTTYNQAKQSGWIKGGLVVHHKDYNGLNNSPDNLEIMTFKEHAQLHASVDTVGEKNGRFSGHSHEDIKQHAIKLSTSVKRRFSTKEWGKYAKENGLPQNFSFFRKTSLGSVNQLSIWAALECGFEHTTEDPRVVKTLQSMIEQGYNSKIENNQVVVEKNCEHCSNTFWVYFERREASFCSKECVLLKVNADYQTTNFRIAKSQKTHQLKAEKRRIEQARIYSALKFSLSRDPFQEEWEEACKKEKLSHRVGKVLRYGFKSWKAVKEAGANYNHKVVSVTEIEDLHTVYNITVDDNHTVGVVTKNDTNKQTGVFLFNCGEIVMGIDSCRLLLINLFGLVKDAYLPTASFDWEAYGKVSRQAQRLMDDVVDLELEAIDRILAKIESDPEPEDVKAIEKNMWIRFRKNCFNGRRTGTGITALGDTLAALGIRYGTKESVDLTEKIYKTLEINCYKSSCILASERGAFPLFSKEIDQTSSFVQKIVGLDEELKKLYEQHGRRNVALTTTAPAGSVSILARLDDNHFGTTSGIEPAYLLMYTRRKKINPNQQGARIDFVDEVGDSWQEYKVYHPGFRLWKEMTNSSDEDIEKSPYWKATSNDVDWEMSVDIQAVAQKFICHSISKTCNLPANTTPELVASVYMRAYESGCKGFTIYRDGCRSGVLVSESSASTPSSNQENSFEDHHAPKRPRELLCDVYQSTVQGEKWTIFVGKMDGKPYELMGGLSTYVKLPKRVKSGKIVKHNGEVNPARYDFHYGFETSPDDETVIQDIGGIFENKTYAAFTRTISLSLRHGVPVQFIVEQLIKGAEKDSDIFSLSRVAARVLKSYIKDGLKTKAKCPQCQGTDLAYQEGCLKCLNTECGYSKCG